MFVASAIAVLGVAGLIWIGSDGGPTASPSAAPSVTQSGRVRGVATAAVTIDEYADFQCPACAQLARTTEKQLLSSYVAAGQVKLVYHYFAFLGQESNWAAEAAECANEQGRFWDMHDRLYESQGAENSGAFTKANLKRIGAVLGLGASFASCVDSGKYTQTVADSTQQGAAQGVRATPTLVINGQRIEGAASYEQLKPIIEAALRR